MNVNSATICWPNITPMAQLMTQRKNVNETRTPSFIYPPENIDIRKNKNTQVRRTGGWG